MMVAEAYRIEKMPPMNIRMPAAISVEERGWGMYAYGGGIIYGGGAM